MGYHLGVDLGTTFTAAAAAIDGGVPTMLGLGNRALQIPSVLYFHPDGTVLVGEAAELRSSSDPARTIREFKRRIGDPVPILAAGRPYSAQALSARVLRWVLDKATEQLGEPPLDVTLTYPANWANFKIDLLRQVAALADVSSARACSEPEAAALQYASRTKVNSGDRIAVYDLGGGTFDVCVLEKTDGGFRILGRPEGIEHLGGIDFDEAVFRQVIDQLPPDAFESGDSGGSDSGASDSGASDSGGDEDAAQMAALARLRRDCVEAKEALSTDVDAVIPVVLPRSRTSVRLTRGEFEDIIRPAVEETIGATRRALRSAETDPSRLTAMVLVGGSSRIPLVAELLGNAFRCPIAVDTHPKNDVAMGAARAATLQGATTPLVTPAPSRPQSSSTQSGSTQSGPTQSGPLRPGGAQPSYGPPLYSGPTSGAGQQAGPTSVTNPESVFDQTTELRPPAAAGWNGYQGQGQGQGQPPVPGQSRGHPYSGSQPPPGGPGQLQGGGQWSGAGAASTSAPFGAPTGGDGARRRKLRLAVIAGAVVVVLAGTAAFFLTQRSGDDSSTGSTPGASSTSPSESGGLSTSASDSVASSSGSSSPAASSTVASPTASVSAIGLPASEPLPDSQLIVSRTDNDNVDLYVVDAQQDTVLGRLTTSPTQDRMPAISPDRSTVIYADQTDTTRVLRVMAANGAGDRLLFATPPPGCTRMNRPAWNPVAPAELAVVCFDEKGKISLQIVNVDGQVLRVLKTGLPRVDDVSYSPDGSKLAFWGGETSSFDGGSIYVMAADGSGRPIPLTNEKVGTDADPVFSPDGSEIAFRRRLPGSTARGNFDIFVIDGDGQNLRQLTNGESNDQDPAWSPDGSEIAFIVEEVGDGGSGPKFLWLMKADGAGQRQLLAANGGDEDSAPAWGRR